MSLFALLHLCDSLFPIGSFAYSDGLESATAGRLVETPQALAAWLDVCLDETIGRTEGPAMHAAWAALKARNWAALVTVDEELTALRPSSTIRAAGRSMGIRLLKTWQAVHPDSLLEKVLALSQPDTRGTRFGPTLPTAFAAACMSTSSWNEPLDLRRALSGYTYTRLAATVSAAMRLMPIGQTEAHQLLGRTLARASSTIDDVLAGRVEAESFTPALDVAQMAQVHLPSRLFRS